jgi:multimeric flavodoxin WrbA
MFLIITASPNTDGLTAACGKAAYDGITVAGGQAEIIDISASEFKPCLNCNTDDGWGPCKFSAKCVIDDQLASLKNKIRDIQGLVLVTPVFFGQPSERMNYFLNRFRRCECFNPNGSAAKDKQVDLIAAPGHSGNGGVSCLAEMEMWCRHVGAIPKDRIIITRFNSKIMLEAIRDAGERFLTGDYFTGAKVWENNKWSQRL